jgi:hypothetical protein
LAVDRPVPRFLTEYFLLMSVGGMVGGVLNALIAPLVFPGVWEFPLAIVAACFVRPTLSAVNWTDRYLMNTFPGLQTWARDQSDQLSQSVGKPATGDPYVLSYTLDIILGLFVGGLAWFMQAQASWGFIGPDQVFRGLVFLGFSPSAANIWWRPFYQVIVSGIPMIIAFFFATRPVRFGIGVACILLVGLAMGRREDTTLFAGRTYFGVLRVLEGEDFLVNRKGEPNDVEEFNNFKGNEAAKPQFKYRFTYLMHGTTYHGRNYIYVPGKDAVDLSRLATTYYHRYGPVGFVMERYNWLPGPQNTFWGDLRMPTSQVGQIAATFGTGALPYANLVECWSEPPYATVGLGTGTMASYARPMQHLTFYEIDEQIRNFSLPPGHEKPFFTYVQGAIRRGAPVEIIMGDARLSMKREEPENAYFPVLKDDMRLTPEFRKGVTDFIHPSPISRGEGRHRERYYGAIELDAFSSDAIPVHLVTIEAIQMYLERIRTDGVLMVHTSNRHLDLVQPVSRIAEELANPTTAIGRQMAERDDRLKNLKYVVAKDQDQREKFLGHFSSEYVMLYFDEDHLKPARNYTKIGNIYDKSIVEWGPPNKIGRSVWTDDFTNIVSIIR